MIMNSGPDRAMNLDQTLSELTSLPVAERATKLSSIQSTWHQTRPGFVRCAYIVSVCNALPTRGTDGCRVRDYVWWS